MDAELSRQSLRLALGAELTHRAARLAGGRISDGADLGALAGELRAIAGPVERAHRLRFAPPYPGVTGGVEHLAGGARRLVLACAATDAAGEAVAVVFTTLICGRAPQVSAAPAGAAIPAGWTALAPG